MKTYNSCQNIYRDLCILVNKYMPNKKSTSSYIDYDYNYPNDSLLKLSRGDTILYCSNIEFTKDINNFANKHSLNIGLYFKYEKYLKYYHVR